VTRHPPDFLIVGAPKCGTTALHAYLGAHPAVAMANRKEPCFWSSDLGRRGRVTDWDEYVALWDDSDEGALCGEASTNYIWSEVAIPAILRARPDARLIAMVRNPIEMAHALHSGFVKGFQDDVGSFERAWRLQEARRRGERLPPECVDRKILAYGTVCALGDQLERLYDLVPEANRSVIVFDDLVADPRTVHLKTLDFLGLADDGRTAFDRMNPNSNMRSAAAARVHRSLPRRFPRAYPPARAAAARVGVSPSAIINRVNVWHGPRPPMRPAFRAELRAFFEPQITKMSRLLGRDLSHWR
jgi:Sulfotransferase domain